MAWCAARTRRRARTCGPSGWAGIIIASPIAAGGLLLNVDEAGNVVVLAASSDFKEVGRIPLGDPSHSTPAVANGRFYFRTFHHLACVAGRP